jgi:hypothetical protein
MLGDSGLPADGAFGVQPLTCSYYMNVGHSNFCDHALDRQYEHGLELDATGSTAAYQIWTHLDRQFVDAAAVVPVWIEHSFELASNTVGN